MLITYSLLLLEGAKITSVEIPNPPNSQHSHRLRDMVTCSDLSSGFMGNQQTVCADRLTWFYISTLAILMSRGSQSGQVQVFGNRNKLKPQHLQFEITEQTVLTR